MYRLIGFIFLSLPVVLLMIIIAELQPLIGPAIPEIVTVS